MTFDGTAPFATTAAEQSWPTTTALAELGEFLKKLQAPPRLERIVGGTDAIAELKEQPAIGERLAGGGVIVETRERLRFRWLMEWSDSAWLCARDGRVYNLPRAPAPLLPPFPCLEQSEFVAVLRSVAHAPAFRNRPVLFPLCIDSPARIALWDKRASKGWRKHVRRVKAAKRRAARTA